jgi:hypothetical protein
MAEELSNKFNGRVENGKIILTKSLAYEYCLKTLEGNEIVLSIRKYRKQRSIRQNRYYWLCINFIASETGNDPDELHQGFKAMFLTDRSGKLPVIKSTARLSGVEFSEYIEKIAVKIAEFGMTLPNVEDFYR